MTTDSDSISCKKLVDALTGDVLQDELAWMSIARHGFTATPETIMHLKADWKQRMTDLTSVLMLGNYRDGGVHD